MVNFDGMRAKHGEFPKSITEADVLAGHAEKRPDKIAMIDGAKRVTYRQLDERANRIANGLNAIGIDRQRRVALMMKNSADYFEIFYGIVRAGRVALPVNWRLASPEVAFVLVDSAVTCLFYDPAFADVVEEVRAMGVELPHCIALDDYGAWLDQQDAAPFADRADPEEVMVQFYTSGTTGHPKGVEISHRASANMRAMEVSVDGEWSRWDSNDVAIVALPNFHLSGTSWGVQWLNRGATCIILPQMEANSFLQAIDEHRVTQMMSIPTVIRMMLDSPILPSVDTSSLRNIFYGGMSMPVPLLREALSVFRANFIQIYGMTENFGTVTYLPPEDHLAADPRLLKSVGKPVPLLSLRIADPDGNELPTGSVGEIRLKSPSMMSGYWNLPTKTAEVMRDGYYCTGDAGYLDEAGYLFLVDRIKDMIVSGGENIYPAEIERVLIEHPQVAEISVVGVPDPQWGEAVLGVVVARDPSLDPGDLISFARGKIAGYKIPRKFVFVDALPRNANGKILKRDLRDRYRDAPLSAD